MNTVSIPKPNYTQIPNVILDDHWPDMAEAEAKVVIAICRQTFGWHKREDLLSLSQLMKLAGLSRQGVINGVEAAMRRGVLGRRQVGQSFMYFVVVNGVDQSTELTRASQRSRPELVNEVDTQKKLTKEKDSPSPEPHRKDTLYESIYEGVEGTSYIPRQSPHSGLAARLTKTLRAAALDRPDLVAAYYQSLRADNLSPTTSEDKLVTAVRKLANGSGGGQGGPLEVNIGGFVTHPEKGGAE